jgi:hypothetical protein
MSNPGKEKGTSWETKIERLLQDSGHDATRIVMRGAEDRGDIEIRLPFGTITIEAKNEKRFDFAGYVEEACKEAERAGSVLGVAWVHRPRKSRPEDGYVVMKGSEFLKVLTLLLG